MKTDFRHGWLKGSSERFGVGTVTKEHFDILICASSWDSRCVAVTNETGLTADHSLLVLFASRDHSGLRDAHDPKLEEFCRKHTSTIHIVKGSSAIVDGLWTQIHNILVSISSELGRRIKILIDISTLPRFLTGALLKMGLARSLCSKIKIFYSEGVYKGVPGDLQGVFTGERWRFVPITGLEGHYYPDKSRFYLVSVGFEGNKTLRYVSRSEPDRVSLLFSDPGFEPEYAARARHNNRELMDYYHIPPEQSAAAHAGDAIAAWKELTIRNFERFEQENVSYLCCGTKPHSLALILRALVLPSAEVLYNVPDIHKVIDTESTGFNWTYDLEDITLISPE